MRKSRRELENELSYAIKMRDYYRKDYRNRTTTVYDLLELLDADMSDLPALRKRAQAKRYMRNHETMKNLARESGENTHA